MLSSCKHLLQSLASQMLHKGSKEIGIIGHQIGTVGWVVCNFPAVAPLPVMRVACSMGPVISISEIPIAVPNWQVICNRQ